MLKTLLKSEHSMNYGSHQQVIHQAKKDKCELKWNKNQNIEYHVSTWQKSRHRNHIEKNMSADWIRRIFLTYNKLSYFSLLTPCRIDERRLSVAASSSTILNIQFELKTFIHTKSCIEQKACRGSTVVNFYQFPRTYLSLTWPEASLADSCTSKASTHFGSESKQINNDLVKKKTSFISFTKYIILFN